MKTKVCSRCDRKLPITAYCVRGSGHRSECKECAAADRRKSRGLKEMVVRKTVDDPKLQAWFDLGLEWRRKVYDPFNAANRYGGLRT